MARYHAFLCSELGRDGAAFTTSIGSSQSTLINDQFIAISSVSVLCFNVNIFLLLECFPLPDNKV